MRIGEFAQICDTKISVLRHYDKEGLLCPDYIDRFSGYRYYSVNQVDAFRKITALKKAGFSLKEIRAILSKSNNTRLILDSIDKKRTELMILLSNLDEAKKIMLGGAKLMENVVLIENTNGCELRMTVANPLVNFRKSCEELEDAAKRMGYQRISSFKTYGDRDLNNIDICIDVIKLSDKISQMQENVLVPFVDDDVIGKWEVVGDYAVKQDFYAEISYHDSSYFGDVNKQIYFLPGGERYWCFGWTKGYLIIYEDDDYNGYLNRYEIEDFNGERYMFVENKSYYYLRGGKPTVLVLRQLDYKAYSGKEIARKDNIDMQFVNDESVIGK